MRTVCVYVQVEARIVEEGERARHYLDPSTESRITKVHVCRALSCQCKIDLLVFKRDVS